MIELKSYSGYRASGVEWLGEIPSHWRTLRNRYLLKETDLRSDSGEENLLSVSQYLGVVPFAGRTDEDNAISRSESLEGYKVVGRGNLVVNIMVAWNGSLGISEYEGIVSPAYCVYKPRTDIDGRYLHYLLRSNEYLAEIKRSSKGVVDSRLRLYTNALFNISSPIPPLDEQRAIADFLDAMDERITRFIAARRRMIALLEEQKQAIINQAVTRGLDPDVPMKPSGVEWLGEIPAHWEPRRLKQVCIAIVDCKNRTPDAVVGGAHTVVRTTNVRNGRFDLHGSFTTDEVNFRLWTQRGAPRVGDVFFTREAPVGEACLVPDIANLCMGQRMMYFRPDPIALDARFLLASIYGPVVRSYIENAVNGSTVGHLRLGQVASLPLLWCPLSEQKQIADFIDQESSAIDALVDQYLREIVLVQEYRTRLISDVVTGKRDVREVNLSRMKGNVQHMVDEAIDAGQTPREIDEHF